MTADIARRNKLPLEKMVFEFGPIILDQPVSKEEFVRIADRHPNLRMEREPDGTVTLMSPVKKGSARRENQIGFLLNLWNSKSGNGEVHGPNGTFDLPNGATKMPDVSWISPQRLENEPDDEENYIQIVPDFVAEVRSASDRLKKLQRKMTETWIANGVRLAWLIDPYEEKVYIYRENSGAPEIVAGFLQKSLSGENVLPGFELPLDTMMRR